MLHTLESYNLFDEYSSTQGPIWYYQKTPIGADTYTDMTWPEGSPNRWVGNGLYQVIYKTTVLAIHPGEFDDTAFVWVAPKTGVAVLVSTFIQRGDSGGDGINLYVNKNNTNLWTEFLDWPIGSGVRFPQIEVEVMQGDNIYFRVNKNVSIENDTVVWNPLIDFWSIADLQNHEPSWEARHMLYLDGSWK